MHLLLPQRTALEGLAWRVALLPWGGDENISRLAGATAGQYIPPAEFRQLIRELGRVLAERTTTYEIRQVFDRDVEAIPV